MAILFFDIDGTLALGTKVPPSAADAIDRTREAGNLVFICSGRPRRYAEGNFGAYADGFVCSNGRLAVRGSETLVSQPLTIQQIRTITGVLDDLNAGYAFCGIDNQYYGGNPAFRAVAEEANGPTLDLANELDTSVDLFNFDVYFVDASEREAIAAALDGMCLVNPHGPHPSADVTILGYGKGDAVRDVTRALGIAHQDSYAFGDGINDLSMIEIAGHGIAMGNAVPELKAAAEFVTTNILDDGIANALAHYGLA